MFVRLGGTNERLSGCQPPLRGEEKGRLKQFFGLAPELFGERVLRGWLGSHYRLLSSMTTLWAAFAQQYW